MPKNVQITLIEDESQISHLKRLQGAEYIGVDSEWKPYYLGTGRGPAILQLASLKECFIVDILVLGQSTLLNLILTMIFEDISTTVLGFNFGSDIGMF